MMDKFYIYISLVFLIACLVFIIVLLNQKLIREKTIGTPEIPKSAAIMTATANTRINASADEVFKVISSFEHYGTGHSQYSFNTQDKTPAVGCMGTYQLYVEDYEDRRVPVFLSMFDRAARKIAAKSTLYPEWLLSSERVQEVISIKGDGNVCEYRTWQTFRGVAVYYLLLTSSEDLNETLRDAASELKLFVEGNKVKCG